MPMADDREVLAEQIAYYRARAPEYDRWWFRTGQYELPTERKAQWDAEVARLEVAVAGLRPTGDVLELACGTGLWTRHLVRHADRLTAVDASPEVLAINAGRTADSSVPVTYVEADLFDWRPPRRFDVVFFSFWLSHVPPARFEAFWSMVGDALVAGGRAIFIDNLWGDGTWRAPQPAEDAVQVRTDLSDGSSHRVVKVYYEPDQLQQRLEALGWRADVGTTGASFLLGTATRPA